MAEASAPVQRSSFDEKNAKLILRMNTKTGYSTRVDAPAVSAAQWGAIQAILAESHSHIGKRMLELFRQFLVSEMPHG